MAKVASRAFRTGPEFHHLVHCEVHGSGFAIQGVRLWISDSGVEDLGSLPVGQVKDHDLIQPP